MSEMSYTVDAQYVARLARDLDYLDTVAQKHLAAYEATQDYEAGRQVVSTLQALSRVYCDACTELLACWHQGGDASTAFEAGRLYGELVAMLGRSKAT